MAAPSAHRETIGSRDQPVLSGVCRRSMGRATGGLRGGPRAFLDRRAAAPWRVRELLDDLLEDIKTGNTEALEYRIEDLQPWQEWLMLHRFDRRRINRRLRQYAEGEPEWMSSEGGRQ